MLRTVLLNEISQMISSITYFETNDFVVETSKNKDGKYVLQIHYRFDPKYKFIAWIPAFKSTDKESYGTDYKIAAQAAPGEIGETENFPYSGKTELFNGIQAWLGRVRDELLAIPVYRQTAAQKEQLEEMLKQFESLDEEYYSQEEAAGLREESWMSWRQNS